MCLVGSRGSTGRRQLKYSLTNNSKFEQDQVFIAICYFVLVFEDAYQYPLHLGKGHIGLICWHLCIHLVVIVCYQV